MDEDYDPIISATDSAQAERSICEHKILLVYFTAAGCNVCQAVKPRILEMAARHRIPIMLIATDEQVEFSAQHLVFTVPTVLLFYAGREISRESRFIDFNNLERTLVMAAPNAKPDL